MRLIDADAFEKDLIDKSFYPVLIRCAIKRAPTVEAAVLPYKRGDRIYVVDDNVKKGYRTTKLNYYQVYADNTKSNIIVKTTAVEHWYSLDEVFPTLDSVKEGVKIMYQKKRESCLKCGRLCSDCQRSDCNAREAAREAQHETT